MTGQVPLRRRGWVGAVLLATSVHAGEFNPVLNIGDQAPAWNDLPGVDGKRHSLSDLAAHEAVVLLFTCNSCPYAVEYEDRSIALAGEFAPRNVAFVAVNVNKVPEDGFEAMRERAAAKKFSFPYLFDESQQVARVYGATNTPEFFVLDRERRVAYMGALDDSTDPSKVTERHVARALDAILRGTRPEVAETVSIGCRIRMESPRRSRP